MNNLRNIDWKNVIISIMLSGLLGYIFKGVTIGILSMVIMTIIMGAVILSEYLGEQKRVQRRRNKNMTKSNNSKMLFTEPVNMIIKRDIGYIIDKTKIDCDEMEYTFEEFKNALSVKIALYIDYNFDKKKKNEE